MDWTKEREKFEEWARMRAEDQSWLDGAWEAWKHLVTQTAMERYAAVFTESK